MPLYRIGKSRESLHWKGESYRRRLREYLGTRGMVTDSEAHLESTYEDIVGTRNGKVIHVESKNTKLAIYGPKFIKPLGNQLVKWFRMPPDMRFSLIFGIKKLTSAKKFDIVFNWHEKEAVHSLLQSIINFFDNAPDTPERLRTTLTNVTYDDFLRFIIDTEIIEASYEDLLWVIDQRRPLVVADPKIGSSAPLVDITSMSIVPSAPSTNIVILREDLQKDASLWLMLDNRPEYRAFLDVMKKRIEERYGEECEVGENKAFSYMHRSPVMPTKNIAYSTTAITQISKLFNPPRFQYYISFDYTMSDNPIITSLFDLFDESKEIALESSPIVEGGSLTFVRPEKPALRLEVTLKDDFGIPLDNLGTRKVLLDRRTINEKNDMIILRIESHRGNYDQFVQVIGSSILGSGPMSLDVGSEPNGLELRFWIQNG